MHFSCRDLAQTEPQATIATDSCANLLIAQENLLRAQRNLSDACYTASQVESSVADQAMWNSLSRVLSATSIDYTNTSNSSVSTLSSGGGTVSPADQQKDLYLSNAPSCALAALEVLLEVLSFYNGACLQRAKKTLKSLKSVS